MRSCQAPLFKNLVGGSTPPPFPPPPAERSGGSAHYANIVSKYLFKETMKAILVLYYWISRVIYLLAMDLKSVNKFQTSVALRTETSHLICIANQMTGFYIKCNTDLRWVTQWYFTTSVVNGPFNLFPWRYLFIFVSFNIENLAWSNMKTNQYVHLLNLS